jgi:hypothetical protein
MNKKLHISWIKTIKENPFLKKWGSFILTGIGFILYFIQTINFAFTQRSILDEGLYLYKGYLFARHVYTPFQDYGFWTQKAPLSYLIYGWVQQLFGAGLRTGRFFSIFTGAIAIIGLWLVTRRIGGRWWAAASVWAVVTNPAVLRYFGAAMSQSLVACLLIWMLFFTLGGERSRWQLLMGGFLAGLMVMTRQNMAPVLLILVWYVVWQHGWKTGLLEIVAVAFPLLVIHAIYWPEILKMWTPWLPARLTPFLDVWRLPQDLSTVGKAAPSAIIESLLEGVRFHFIALTGGLTALMLWPSRTFWKDEDRFRGSTFLAVLFIVLFITHAWAGLGNTSTNNNNAFTFSPYLTFFDFLGILLIISVLQTLRGRRISAVQQVLVVLFQLVVSTGIGLSVFNLLGDYLAKIRLPRISNFSSTWKFLPGNVMLWQILFNKFGIKYDTSRLFIPAVVLTLLGVLIICVGLAYWSSLHRKGKTQHSFTSFIVTIFLLIGIILAPTRILGGGFLEWNCSGNILKAYEESGHYLAKVIPPNSQVYWDGGNAVAVLLDVPQIRIYPQQFDDVYNYFQAGDSDSLARMGFWNAALARRWRDEADVFLFQDMSYVHIWGAYVDTPAFSTPTQPQIPLNCKPDTFVRIFIRNR